MSNSNVITQMNRRDRNLNKNSNITMQQSSSYQQSFKKGSARLYSQAAALTSCNNLNLPIGQSLSSFSIGRLQQNEQASQNFTGMVPRNQQSQAILLKGECSPIQEEIEQKQFNKMPKIKDSLLSTDFKQNFSSYKDFQQNSKDDQNKQKKMLQDQSSRYAINTDHIGNSQIQIGVQSQKSSMPDIASRKNIQQANRNYLNSLTNNRANEISQKKSVQKKQTKYEINKIDDVKIDKQKLIFQKSNAEKFKIVQGPDDFLQENEISHRKTQFPNFQKSTSTSFIPEIMPSSRISMQQIAIQNSDLNEKNKILKLKRFDQSHQQVSLKQKNKKTTEDSNDDKMIQKNQFEINQVNYLKSSMTTINQDSLYNKKSIEQQNEKAQQSSRLLNLDIQIRRSQDKEFIKDANQNVIYKDIVNLKKSPQNLINEDKIHYNNYGSSKKKKSIPDSNQNQSSQTQINKLKKQLSQSEFDLNKDRELYINEIEQPNLGDQKSFQPHSQNRQTPNFSTQNAAATLYGCSQNTIQTRSNQSINFDDQIQTQFLKKDRSNQRIQVHQQTNSNISECLSNHVEFEKQNELHKKLSQTNLNEGPITYSIKNAHQKVQVILNTSKKASSKLGNFNNQFLQKNELFQPSIDRNNQVISIKNQNNNLKLIQIYHNKQQSKNSLERPLINTQKKSNPDEKIYFNKQNGTYKKQINSVNLEGLNDLQFVTVSKKDDTDSFGDVTHMSEKIQNLISQQDYKNTNTQNDIDSKDEFSIKNQVKQIQNNLQHQIRRFNQKNQKKLQEYENNQSIEMSTIYQNSQNSQPSTIHHYKSTSIKNRDDDKQKLIQQKNNKFSQNFRQLNDDRNIIIKNQVLNKKDIQVKDETKGKHQLLPIDQYQKSNYSELQDRKNLVSKQYPVQKKLQSQFRSINSESMQQYIQEVQNQIDGNQIILWSKKDETNSSQSLLSQSNLSTKNLSKQTSVKVIKQSRAIVNHAALQFKIQNIPNNIKLSFNNQSGQFVIKSVNESKNIDDAAQNNQYTLKTEMRDNSDAKIKKDDINTANFSVTQKDSIRKSNQISHDDVMKIQHSFVNDQKQNYMEMGLEDQVIMEEQLEDELFQIQELQQIQSIQLINEMQQHERDSSEDTRLINYQSINFESTQKFQDKKQNHENIQKIKSQAQENNRHFMPDEVSFRSMGSSKNSDECRIKILQNNVQSQMVSLRDKIVETYDKGKFQKQLFTPFCNEYIDLHTEDYQVEFVSKFDEFNFNQEAQNIAINGEDNQDFEKSTKLRDGGIKIKVNKDKGLLDNHPTYFSQDLDHLIQNNGMSLIFYDFNGFKSSLSYREKGGFVSVEERTKGNLSCSNNSNKKFEGQKNVQDTIVEKINKQQTQIQSEIENKDNFSREIFNNSRCATFASIEGKQSNRPERNTRFANQNSKELQVQRSDSPGVLAALYKKQSLKKQTQNFLNKQADLPQNVFID